MPIDRSKDTQARDKQEDVDALNAGVDRAADDEAQAKAAADAIAKAEADAAAVEQAEPSDEAKDAAAQDPLNEEVQIVVADEFRSEDGSPIEVSIAGLTEKFPADGSVIDVTERQARLYEESPAVERVPQADEVSA